MRTTRLFFLTILTTSALGGAGVDPAPATADDKKSLTRLPNGVTDAAGEVGYLTAPQGDGLVAVDLETGKALWETKEANQTLVVDGTRLIARTGRENRLRIVVLDTTAKGKRLLESEPLDLPTWVAVARPWTAQGQNRTFVVGGQMVGGALELDWSAYTGYWGGARPSPEQEKGRTALGRGEWTSKRARSSATRREGRRPSRAEEKPGAAARRSVRPHRLQGFSRRGASRRQEERLVDWLSAGAAGLGVRGSDKHYMLQAADVKTGKVLWERPIREWVAEHPPR